MGFKYNEAQDIIKGEVNAVHTAVGLCEVSGFNRFEITGADAHNFLDRMICGRVTRKQGRVGLGYLLNHHGMIKAEATIANMPDGSIWYGSAAAAEFHDMDWLQKHIGTDEDVQIKSLTNNYTILVLAGPKSRDVMSTVSRDDWSAGAMPWLHVRDTFIGIAPASVMTVSFSGELAYEIHIPNNQLYAAYLALREAGEKHGLQLFGARAVDSMRMEKGFLHWKADLLTEFTPFETGLDRFVKMDKGDFIGKAALEKQHQQGLRTKLVTIVIDDDVALAHGGASIMVDGRVVGTVSSGDYGHRVGKNIAYAFVDPEFAAEGTTFEIDIIGKLTPATVVEQCLYDPTYALMRS